MSAGRAAEQDYLKALAAPYQLRQIGRCCDIGDMPAPGLLEQRQSQALAAQWALIHDCKMAAHRPDKPAAICKPHLAFAELVEPVQVDPSPSILADQAKNDFAARLSG